MRLVASAIYRPKGDSGRYIEAHVTPAVRASVQAACKLVETAAKAMAPVDTGALRDSISTEINETAKTVVGNVAPHVPYAAFVEFGTGIAGAASPGAGLGPYSLNWRGMPAQPYMRPAMDESRGPILEIFKGEIASGLR